MKCSQTQPPGRWNCLTRRIGRRMGNYAYRRLLVRLESDQWRNGETYEHDVAIDRGEITKRKKNPSKKFRDLFSHMPLSMEEQIPWKCRQLISGNGFTGVLRVMDAVKRTAEK